MRRSPRSGGWGRALMIHPAAVLLVWLPVLLTALSIAGSRPLVGLALLAVAGTMACHLAYSRLRALLRRTRYLIVAIVVCSALMTPGELVPLCSWITYEGLHSAANQLMALFMVLVSLSLLMHFVLPDQLVLGMLFLMQPIRRLGLDPTRLAVRMTLVLAHTVQPSEVQQMGFRDVMRKFASDNYLSIHASTICLEQRRWAPIDHLVCTLTLIGCLSVFAVRSTGFA